MSTPNVSPARGPTLQQAIRDTIKRSARNGSLSLSQIAHNLGTNRLACSAALRAMERRGEAGYFRSHPGDRWSAQMWYLCDPKAQVRSDGTGPTAPANAEEPS